MVDREQLPAPVEGLVVTHFLTVRDVARSRAFYADVLGGEVVLEENPAIVTVATQLDHHQHRRRPHGRQTLDHARGPARSGPGTAFLNIRVADIAAVYADWSAKGAQFLTEPIDRGPEIRCYLRDPDGHLIEVGQSRPGHAARRLRRLARLTPSAGEVARFAADVPAAMHQRGDLPRSRRRVPLQLGEHPVGDGGDAVELLVGERVEDESAHGAHVSRCRPFDGRTPCRCQHPPHRRLKPLSMPTNALSATFISNTTTSDQAGA